MSDLTDNQFYPSAECIWLCIRLNNAEKYCDITFYDFDKKIIFPDEDIFDPGGYVNKQNCKIWSTENLHAYIEKPTHPKRETVWCVFWSRDIIGHFFFESVEGEAFTVNGDRYRTMLNVFLFTKIEEEDIGKIWFQQNGATCHTAEATIDVLHLVCEDRIIRNLRSYSAVLFGGPYSLPK